MRQAAVPAFRDARSTAILVALHLPEWNAVRTFPQRNAYHATNRRPAPPRGWPPTGRRPRESAGWRGPTSCSWVALLHTSAGVILAITPSGTEVVASLAPRPRVPSDDVDTLVALVRHHLLCPTRHSRDLADPGTIRTSSPTPVGDRATLELLAALTELTRWPPGPRPGVREVLGWSRRWSSGSCATSRLVGSSRPPPPLGRAWRTSK